MGKIKDYLSYLPKHPVTIFAGILMAVALTATAIAGFGPDRPTKAYEGPGTTPGFDYVTFNSFTGVPGIGDERQFHNGQYAGESSFHPELTQLRDGDEITMNVYIHNNADSSLNASGEGIARNVNVAVDLPEGTALSSEARATVSASNANPTSVWSTTDFSADDGGYFELDYVEGSATVTDNNGTRAIGDELVSTGVNLGDIRGCFEYVTVIEYKVKVNQPNYRIEKEVSVDGEEWLEEVQMNVGDTVNWSITFENTGSVDLNNVIIVDDLPDYNTVVPGSVKLINTNFPQGDVLGPEAVQKNGTQINVNTGTVPAGAGFYLNFQTTIDEIPNLECNRYRFQNVAYATPEGYSHINNGAYVVVEGPCNPDTFVRCNVLNASILSGRTVEVAADIEKSENVTITGYEFNWGDGNVNESSSNSARHTYAADGNYHIVATVNHEGGSSTAVTCEADVSFNTPTPPPTPPEHPPELPNTGPAAAVAGLLGTGTLAGATHAWVNSRRALKKSLLG